MSYSGDLRAALLGFGVGSVPADVDLSDGRGALRDRALSDGELSVALRRGADDAPVPPSPPAQLWHGDLIAYIQRRRFERESRRYELQGFARHVRWQADEGREPSKPPAFVGVATGPARKRHPYVRLRARDCNGLYFVPVTCADVLCPECMKRKGAAEARRWLPVLQAMYSPKLLTLTTRNTVTAQEGRDELQRAFRSFCELSLGKRGLPGLLADALAFVAESPDEAQRARFVDELARFEQRVKRLWRKSARSVRMRDLLGKGWRSIEVTYSPAAGWHWHIHAALDMAYIPQPFIVAAWRRATRGTSQVCDVRRIGKTEKDIREVTKYVSKSWEIPERARDELRNALYGMQRVKAIGGARPVDELHVCPCCGKSECTAARASGELRTLADFELSDGTAAALVEIDGVPTVLVEFKPGFWRVADAPLLNVGALAQQGAALLSGAGPPGVGPPGVSDR